MCTVSYHFEDNRVLNDILKRLYKFPRWIVSKVYKSHMFGQTKFLIRTIITIIKKMKYFSIHIWLKLLRE
jgi:hypothetical protein